MSGVFVLSALLLAVGVSSAEEAKPSPFERDVGRYWSFFDRGPFAPDVESLFPSGYTSRWSPSATVTAGYSDNIDKDERSRDAFSSDALVGLGWTRRSPRLDGLLEYRAGTALYQSDVLAGRNSTSQRAAATANWRAQEYLSVFGGGHFGKNIQQSLDANLTGVRASYRNRSDEAEAHGGYAWRPSRSVTNDGAYSVSYRNYLASRAEGDDTRRHSGSESLWYQATERQKWGLGYRFGLEEALDGSERRENHGGTLSWAWATPWSPADLPSELLLSYTVDRGLVLDASDYWNHHWKLGYSTALSPRTQAGASTGFQWIRPDGENERRAWTWGVDATHRLSEHTTGTLAASRAWEYVPASSRTDLTVLTQILNVTASLRSEPALYWSAKLDAAYTQGERDAEIGIGPRPPEGDYWAASATAALRRQVGRERFVGGSFGAYRRLTENSDDDYVSQTLGAYVDAKLLTWLSFNARYSYERKRFDMEAARDSYHENRVVFGLTASI